VVVVVVVGGVVVGGVVVGGGGGVVVVVGGGELGGLLVVEVVEVPPPPLPVFRVRVRRSGMTGRLPDVDWGGAVDGVGTEVGLLVGPATRSMVAPSLGSTFGDAGVSAAVPLPAELGACSMTRTATKPAPTSRTALSPVPQTGSRV
jgi:hypothetical protein